MSAVAYMDFVAAQCLVSISNRSVVSQPDVTRESDLLRIPEEEEEEAPSSKEMSDPRDAWKDYCTLVTIAKSLLDLNKYRPIPTPSICSDSVESPDEDAGSDSDVTTESGSSPSHSPGETVGGVVVPDPLALLPAKGKLATEKRHKCPYSGCGKVYGKSSHLKAHYRVHTATLCVSTQLTLRTCIKMKRMLYKPACQLSRVKNPDCCEHLDPVAVESLILRSVFGTGCPDSVVWPVIIFAWDNRCLKKNEGVDGQVPKNR